MKKRNKKFIYILSTLTVCLLTVLAIPKTTNKQTKAIEYNEDTQAISLYSTDLYNYNMWKKFYEDFANSIEFNYTTNESFNISTNYTVSATFYKNGTQTSELSNYGISCGAPSGANDNREYNIIIAQTNIASAPSSSNYAVKIRLYNQYNAINVYQGTTSSYSTFTYAPVVINYGNSYLYTWLKNYYNEHNPTDPTTPTNYQAEIHVTQKAADHYNDGTNESYITKYSGQSSDNNFLINEYAYGNTYYQTGSEPIYTTYITDTFLPQTNSLMHVFQITPYSRSINNTVQLNINVALIPLLVDDPTEYTITTKVLRSTHSYWSKYLDYSITDAQLNYDAYNDITNSQLGFTYTEDTYLTDIEPNNNTILLNPTYNITIDPNLTNYIYIYTYINSDTAATQVKMNGPQMFTPHLGQYTSAIFRGTIQGTSTGYEIIDLPGLMWQIVGMPYAFISVAFNLTLFPGTPYQINLSNLFLSIIGAIVFIFILKLFINRN